MNDEEKLKLRSELCKRWPKKFSKEDLDYWSDHLGGFELADVTMALTKFRNQSAFRPKIHEITAMMPGGMAGTANTSINEGSAADVLRRQCSWLRNAGDKEVYVRWWRQQFWTHKDNFGNVEALKHRCEIGCYANLMNVEKMEVEEARRIASSIFDEPDMFRHTLDDLRGLNVDPFVQRVPY